MDKSQQVKADLEEILASSTAPPFDQESKVYVQNGMVEVVSPLGTTLACMTEKAWAYMVNSSRKRARPGDIKIQKVEIIVADSGVSPARIARTLLASLKNLTERKPDGAA